ncbi:MAG: hypothetical protein V2I33_19230 [Kangiellaceae bacterium]|jgi:hypothetical protein|nr:hypothetical protein [Kangiellaceae bacterium]
MFIRNFFLINSSIQKLNARENSSVEGGIGLATTGQPLIIEQSTFEGNTAIKTASLLQISGLYDSNVGGSQT